MNGEGRRRSDPTRSDSSDALPTGEAPGPLLKPGFARGIGPGGRWADSIAPMLIPLGTDRPLRRPTVVTYGLLAVNIGMFVVQQVLERTDPDRYAQMMGTLAVSREGFGIWQLFTASFLHIGWMHIIGNALFLWVFGPNIEDRMGRGWYLLFYLLGGAAAMGAHVAVTPVPAVGASGSIAALTGAYLVMFPRTMIKVFSLIFVIGLTWVTAWWFIGLSVVWDLFAQMSGARTGTAHAAHLGGYAFGAAVAFTALWLNVLPRETYDLFTQGRQMKRRREFRAASRQWDQRVEQTIGADAAARGKPEDAAAQEALAAARLAVTEKLRTGDLAGAATAYTALADRYGHLPRAATLARNQQYQLAAHLYTSGAYPSAAYAFERFLEAYPRDPDGPQIRLLLGRLNARHLNDPVRAKALLQAAIDGLRDEETRTLAKQELEALG